MLKALKNIKKVISILSNSADGTTAKNTLQTDLKISEAQANSILAMPLRRITGLEKQKLEEEYKQLQERINQLQQLLEDRNELLKALKKELRSLKRKFADNRKTKILNLKSIKEEKTSKTTTKQTKKESLPSLPSIFPKKCQRML